MMMKIGLLVLVFVLVLTLAVFQVIVCFEVAAVCNIICTYTIISELIIQWQTGGTFLLQFATSALRTDRTGTVIMLC